MNDKPDATLSKEQQTQEDEYEFPYHHIPKLTPAGFTQTFTWAWGAPYLGGIRFITDKIEEIEFNSLIDIGCGDGRFLTELSDRFPGKRLMGVDYSKRAIDFAHAFCPQVDFRCLNLISDELHETFDIATLVEVYEHLPPRDAVPFLRAVTRNLNAGGTLILTVPHTNAPLQTKHYRHFDSATLGAELNMFFHKVTIIPFDKRPPVIRFLDKICNRQDFLFGRQKLLNLRWSYYVNHCLHNVEERECRRIAAICSDKRAPESGNIAVHEPTPQ